MQQSMNHVHISWDVLYVIYIVMLLTEINWDYGMNK